MVTPTALNGAGCAAAMPAVSAEASNKTTKVFVLTDASLLSWISKLVDLREHSAVFKVSRAFAVKNRGRRRPDCSPTPPAPAAARIPCGPSLSPERHVLDSV